MPHAMQLRDQRPRLPTQRVVRACLCVALASTTACTFDAGGTGEARTRRSSAFGPISAEPSARDMDEAAQIAADRLRELGEQRAAAEAAAAGKPQAGHAPAMETPAAGTEAPSSGQAGETAGSAGAVSQPIVPKGDGRNVVPGMPAADGGRPGVDESDGGDEADAGAPPIAGAAPPPPMAAGSSGGSAEAGASGMSAGGAGAGAAGRGSRDEMKGRSGAGGAGGGSDMAGRSGSEDARDVSGDTDESSDEGGDRGNGNGG